MKALRRLCTILLGMVLMAVGALLVLCVNNAGIRQFWMNSIDYIVNSFWIGTITAVVLLFLGVIAVVIGVHVKKVVPYTKVSMGEFGQVDISLAAIDTVVSKVAKSFEGVRDVKTRIKSDNAGISVLLDVVMNADCNIPETVALLQQDVKTQLETTVGISVISVKTAITNIAAAQ